ncbi:MAG TPA: phosphate ABC transporter permease subunit PstC, partial [Gemmataceae bacterium]|nr:phosphate ABC transporter permease subunit PstC [Gemmataceae bacterium]
HPPPATRQFGDNLFRRICLSAGFLIIGLAVLLVVTLIVKSWDTLTGLGLSFFTTSAWNPVEELQEFGALAFVYGTLMTSAIAMLIAVPLGVGTAAFLSEIAPGWLRRIASFLVEMLAAIPSVVYGFWGVFALAPALQRLFSALGLPNTGGLTILSAGLVLAVMIIPYVTAVSYDVCRAVPKSQREAALALGATRWQMIRSAVLPYARPGIIGACFLALGRAIGETMAVTMLIGNTPTFPRSLWDISPFVPGDSIASQLAGHYHSADYANYSAALTELALVLLLVTVITNTLARLLIWRVTAATTIVRGPDTRPLWRQRVGQVATLLRAGAGFVFPLLVVAFVANWLLTNLLRTPAYLPVQWVGLPDAYGYFTSPVVLNLVVLMAATLLVFWGVRWLIRLIAADPTRFAKIVNVLMLGVLGLCALLTIVPLFQILYDLVRHGIGSINWNFFSQTTLNGGMANALLGSAILVGLASLFAVPVGLLAAIYLAENRNSRVGSVIRFIGELLGGVPSVVIGIYIYAIFIGPGILKMSGWTGAFALGIMMIPVIMRASEEALKLVPEAIRQASYALGASQWQTVARVIVPAALPAIITGVFLAVARIAGETAPLILTAGDNMYFPRSINDRMPSVPYLIYNASREPNQEDVKLAWAAALVLLMLVMLLNFGVRVLTGKRVVLASRAD